MNNEYFYFNEDDIEHKLYVNLSNDCLSIVNEDRNTFSLDEKAIPVAGFLNAIFANFYKDADATISERCYEKSEELQTLYSSKEFKGIDKRTIGSFIDKYIKKYECDLISKATSHESGEGIRFRCNNENYDLLVESTEGEHYDNSVGLYLKAVFEEYASLPRFKRERIYFIDTYNKILQGISLEKKIKISQYNKTTVKGDKKYSRKFYISPYKILQDKANLYNYIVCIAEPINPDGSLGEKSMSSFRLSYIEKADVHLSKGAHISKEKKDELDEEIKKRTVQYMAGHSSLVKVRFSNKGLDNYQRQLYMRPEVFEKIDDNTFIFKCTESQATNYFFKFGWDVEILEPLSLRETFIKRYDNALRIYKGESRESIAESNIKTQKS